VILLLAAALAPPLHCEAAEPSDYAVCGHENELFEFRSVLPYAALEIRPLGRALTRRMDADREGAVSRARAARAQARREGYPYNRHMLAYDWSVLGRNWVLVSLFAEVTRYEGGGHAEDEADTILWDIGARRSVDTGALFGAPARARLEGRVCAALRATLSGYDGADCPSIGWRQMAPKDADGNGIFDTLAVFYTSSLYDVGRVPVDIAFEAEDLAEISDRYRRAFEVPGDRINPLPDE